MSLSFKNQLIEKIETKNIKVGIIGLGYVGLPLMLSFAEAGFKILGFDVDPTKIKMINKGESYIKHIGSAKLQEFTDNKLIEATDDFSRAGEADAIILCVPTPLNKYREPDISYVINSIEAVQDYIREGQIISLESTTYPGTTEEIIKPRIEKNGLKVGDNIFLVYSPEREDPGNKNFQTSTIPKVVGGHTQACLELGEKLYSSVIKKIIPVSSTKTAEFTKLLENIYRAVNIGLVNEMKIITDRMDVDIWEVIDAAASKPFGFKAFYPGPGWGGHCIPIDPFYLTWKAREYELHTRFIEAAGEINTAITEWVVGKIGDALNTNKKAINGAKIIILGISYKKNIDDMRESPSVKLMESLRKKGAEISYSDPYIPIFPKMREHKFDLKSVDIMEESLQKYDCVVLATDHDAFDYDFIQKNSKIIVDTRGKYRKIFKNVVKS